ncbi:AAA family ATPase [Vibrio crassostreae]|uniref:AAA family ATPase n=1 Tax=Vibrio crassostreae TaxID=246167 RepID=UPI001B300D7F|nr:AAA family ATPase [Vibrio crassostreae]
MSNKPYTIETVATSEIFPHLGEQVPSILSTLTRKKWTNSNRMVPTVNPNYIFRNDIGFKKLLRYLETGKGQKPFLFGPKGAGKTSTPMQIAARLGAVVREEYVGPNTEAMDMAVRIVPSKLGLEEKMAIVVEAMTYGEWVIINEFDTMLPLEQKRLNGLWEDNRLTLPSGKTLVAHDDFRVIVTANTNNTGDHTGEYSGVGKGDSSVGDRFFFVEFNYLSKEEETRVLEQEVDNILNNIFGKVNDKAKQVVNKIFIPTIVEYADDVRLSHGKTRIEGGVGSGLPFGMSTRKTLAWLESAVEEIAWSEHEASKATPADIGRIYKRCVTESLDITFIKGQDPQFAISLGKFLEDRSAKRFGITN